MPDPPSHTEPDKSREYTPLGDVPPSQMVSTITNISTATSTPNPSQGTGVLRSSPFIKGSFSPYNKAKRKTRTNSVSSADSTGTPGGRTKNFGGEIMGIQSWSEAVAQEDGQGEREGHCPLVDLQDFTNPSLYPSTAASTQPQPSDLAANPRPGSATPTRASSTTITPTQISSTDMTNIQFFWETGECGDFTPDEDALEELVQGCEKAQSITHQLILNAAKCTQTEYKIHLSLIINKVISSTESFLTHMRELQDSQDVIPSSQEDEDATMDEDVGRGHDVMDSDVSEQTARRLEDSIHAPNHTDTATCGDTAKNMSAMVHKVPETSDPVAKFLIEQLLNMGNQLDKLEGKQNAGPTAVRTLNTNATVNPRVSDSVHVRAHHSGPTPAEAARLPNSSKKSYATTVSNNPRAGNKSNSTAQAPKISNQPPANSKPKTPAEVRMVLRVQGGMPKDRRIALQPPIIKYEIENILNKRTGTEKARLLESHWNISGNLVMLFSPSTNPQNILNVEDEIKRALKVPAPSSLIRDVPWSKVVLANIPTGVYNIQGDRRPFTEETLLDELHGNDFFRRVRITQTPKWLSPAEKIDKFTASVSVAFEDPDGSLLRQLRSERISMFGRFARIKRWNDKPLLKVCGKCLSYDHDQTSCKLPARCHRCADTHPTEQHDAKCQKCKQESRPTSDKCKHPAHCGVCKGDHPFNHSICPTRAKYRVPITASLLARHSEEMQE